MKEEAKQMTGKVEQNHKVAGVAVACPRVGGCLARMENSDQLVLNNYNSIGPAPGMAFIDFGFLGPTLLAALPRYLGRLLILTAVGLCTAVSDPAWSQTTFTRAEQECWNRNPGQIEYVKCIASTMEPIDPAKREWYGEFYGAKEYMACALNRPGDSYCDRHRLKRRHEQEFWPNGRAAGFRWPDAPKESVYRPTMSSREYFDALCKSEAGEFIYKSVENVTGIYQIRPRLKTAAFELEDRNVMEDPYGYSNGEATEPENYFVQPPLGVYQFLEVPDPQLGGPPGYVRYFRGDPVPGKSAQVLEKRPDGNLSGRKVPYIVHREGATSLKSKYGFTWRGIRRANDRAHSIAGGELAVVDLQTYEVLGLRRGFALTRTKESKRGLNWEISVACTPALVGSQGHLFVKRVLRSAK